MSIANKIIICSFLIVFGILADTHNTLCCFALDYSIISTNITILLWPEKNPFVYYVSIMWNNIVCVYILDISRLI